MMKKPDGEETVPDRVDYSHIPEGIEDALEPEPEIVEKETSINFDGDNYVARIPVEVGKIMGIEKDHKLRFMVRKPHPKEGGEPTLTIEYKRQ